MSVRVVMLTTTIVLCGCTPPSGNDTNAHTAEPTPPTQEAAFLPGDPKPTCAVPSAIFQSWFESQNVTENGLVNPADSVDFAATSTSCDFYRWSEQMFLWLTSPASSTHGENGFVFSSPVFFNVSPPDDHGKRQLVPNASDHLHIFPFPVRTQKPEEIGETGQAGGSGVLLSQGGSLVYYGIHVNDVYAYFLTGLAGNQIDSPLHQFPSIQTDLTQITDYVDRLGLPQLPDAPALTLELKTAWIDASTVGDVSQFVTINASVPEYDRSNPVEWVAKGETELLELALVGMHVVGTVLDHPEMIWATFEHATNSPNNAYYYTNDQDTLTRMEFDSSGDWLFMPTNGPKPKNHDAPVKSDQKGNIVSVSGDPIGPVPVYRENPWGSAHSSEASQKNNTEIISINQSVIGQLVGKDVRQNYAFTGGIWTRKGKIPTQQKATLDGSLRLANTTMETFHQDKNCFSCHATDAEHPRGLDVSHIFGDLEPLDVK
jgi:hypothetical protein